MNKNIIFKEKQNLLNLLNYKLFTMKNRLYLQHIDKLISKKEFLKELNNKNIKIDFLDNSISSYYQNEIFKIYDKGIVKFLHYQNLITFNFQTKKVKTEIMGVININIKNQQCYELIRTLLKLQKKFLFSNIKQDLKYFSHKEILESHKKSYTTALISSNISTISHNSFYRDKHNNVFKLNFLIPKKHFIVYIHIKYLLNNYTYLTDKKLSFYLEKEFNICISHNKICAIRKRYLIPSLAHRDKNIYLEYESKYSQEYLLTLQNIANFKDINAVYELRGLLKHRYQYRYSNTVYIGSTNNLQRRLTQYLNNLGHTKKIRDFVLDGNVYFRFIKSENYKDLEKDILEAFHTTCGNYPFLNSYRVLLSSMEATTH